MRLYYIYVYMYIFEEEEKKYQNFKVKIFRMKEICFCFSKNISNELIQFYFSQT